MGLRYEPRAGEERAMPDLLAEDVLSTAAAARYLNQRIPDGRFTPTGTWRCMTKGSLSRSGERIFLEHIKLGRKLFTSKQALTRFASRLARVGAAEQNPDTIPAQRTNDARADLERDGFFN